MKLAKEVRAQLAAVLTDPGTLPSGTLFRGTKNKRVRRAVTTLAMAQAGYSVVNNLREAHKSSRQYRVVIDSRDDVYERLIAATFEMVKETDAKFLEGVSDYLGDGSYSVAFFQADESSSVIVLDGHEIDVSVGSPKGQPGKADNKPVDDSMGYASTKRHLTFTMPNREARDAVREFINEVAARTSTKKRTPRLQRYGKWGWSVSPSPIARKKETVILDGTIMEDVLTDVSTFLDSESEYTDWGLPWHRGYLFYGPPGTGKTSIGKVIASENNLDIYYLSLSSIADDAAFFGALAEISPRSVVVFEDIDIVHGASDRSDDAGGVTLGGLLNGLDGMLTPHGLISIMTTNNRDVLDEALLRPGRTDIEIKIDFATREQIERMVKVYLQTDIVCPELTRDVAPSEIVEALKQIRETPEKALEAVIGVIEREPAVS